MTDKPTPTDAELNTILCDHWPAFAMQSTLVKIWVRDALQDAIDKFGQPAQVAEPVAWLRNTTDPQPHAVTNLKYRSAVDAKAGVEYIPVFAAPQPVAREPLTDEHIQDLLLCGNPTDEEMRLIRIGWDAAHGIKGASMALSNRDCRHGRQIGKCADCDLDYMEMAADAEARRVDELTALR